MHSPAPLWKRLFSTLYDVIILGAVSLFYFAVATAFFEWVLQAHAEDFLPNAQGLGVQLGWLITLIGFYTFFWKRVGQTVAMKAWRLKVVRTNGEPLRWQDCLLRCASGFLLSLPAALSYWWILVDKERCALHDRLSKTRVILLPKGE